MKRNVIVGQSGGPTAAINSSLAGVYLTAKECGAKTVYGMLNGIQGLLEGRYIDLSEHIKNGLDAELLKRTPSSVLGSCRYKMAAADGKDAVYEQIISTLKQMH
ncbi:MAG: 6-phosphofructokinase, partial [Lachnospiraceae bacterium]|nr:6-phosphofructokinase [Lachnospiraceae bacterium]